MGGQIGFASHVSGTEIGAQLVGSSSLEEIDGFWRDPSGEFNLRVKGWRIAELDVVGSREDGPNRRLVPVPSLITRNGRRWPCSVSHKKTRRESEWLGHGFAVRTYELKC